jgi:predicted PurR-regulated permease PerM
MVQGEFTFDKVVRIFLVALCIVSFFVVARYLSDVLIPFAVAFLLAYLMNPLVNAVQAKVQNRAGAVALSFLLLGVAGVAVLWFGLPMIGQELANMGALVNKIVSDKELGARALAYLPPELWDQVKGVFSSYEMSRVRELVQNDNVISLVQAVAKKVLPGMWSVVSGATSLLLGVLGLFFIFLYLVFILMDYQHLKVDWKDLLPKPLREPVVGFLDDFDSEMRKYFRGQAIVAALVGVVFMVGFGMIDLPMAIGMGLLLGVLNMVPYLQTIGLFPAVAFAVVHALEVGSSPLTATILVLVVFLVAQVVQDAFLVPKIMGKVTGLSPAIILLSVSIWGKLLGLLGLVIALPMTCLCLAWYKRAISHFEDKESLI